MKTKKSKVIDRQKTHGPFKEFAATAQSLKDIMRAQPNWIYLGPDMREALDMVQHKVARILTGDPAHLDHWADIQGYVARVSERLNSDGKA